MVAQRRVTILCFYANTFDLGSISTPRFSFGLLSLLSPRSRYLCCEIVILSIFCWSKSSGGHVMQPWSRHKLCNHRGDIRETYVPSGVALTLRRFIFMRHSFNETHVNNATYAHVWITDEKMSLVERLKAFFELFLSD